VKGAKKVRAVGCGRSRDSEGGEEAMVEGEGRK
jgi:hypothetical protein